MSHQESSLSVKHWRNFLNERKKCGPGETLIRGGDGEPDMCADTEDLEHFVADPTGTHEEFFDEPFWPEEEPEGWSVTDKEFTETLSKSGILFNRAIDLDSPYFAMPARFDIDLDDIEYDDLDLPIDKVTKTEVPMWLVDVLNGKPIGWMEFDDMEGIKVLPGARRLARTWASPMSFMQLRSLGNLGTEQGYPFYVEDAAELKDTGDMLRLGQKLETVYHKDGSVHSGHDSHGSGRDFDISIPFNPNVLPSGQSIKKDGSGFLKKWNPLLKAKNLDVGRALAVIRHFSPTSQKIAIDKRYHPALRKHARELKENGVMSQSEYNTIFKSGQLVSWGGKNGGNHANHFHVRLKSVHAMQKIDFNYASAFSYQRIPEVPDAPMTYGTKIPGAPEPLIMPPMTIGPGAPEREQETEEKPFWEEGDEDVPSTASPTRTRPTRASPTRTRPTRTKKRTRTRKPTGARLPVDPNTGKTRAWTPEELEILRSLDESQKIINIVNEQMPGMDPAAQRLQMQKQVIQMQLGPIITQALDFIFTLGSLDDPAAANQSSMYENRVESIIRDFNDGKMEPQEASVSLGRVVDEMGRKVQKFMS